MRFDLFEGWDREQDAYADASGLAYVSGPMYERHYEADGSEVTVPLGDIKFGNQIWRGRNRSIFDPFEEDDGSYRPYKTAQQGSIMNLKLEPHPSSGEPVRYIPYLQPITIELHEETHQLCLLCHDWPKGWVSKVPS